MSYARIAKALIGISKDNKNQGIDSFCPRCGTYGDEAIYVHGHYQCSVCNCVIDDCCQGERTTAPAECSINKEQSK